VGILLGGLRDGSPRGGVVKRLRWLRQRRSGGEAIASARETVFIVAILLATGEPTDEQMRPSRNL
jgi:hypothetical protein